jgi:PST family polysaccharide transporter
MSRYLKILSESKFAKVSLFSAVSTLVKIFTAFILSKFVSIYTGASGIGVLGQFTSFFTMILPMSAGGILTGVTKYTSEYYSIQDDLRLKKLFKSALSLVLLISVLGSIVLISGASFFSFWLFNSTDYKWLITTLGVFLCLSSVNSLFLAIINGLQQFKAFNIINILTSVAGLLLTVIFISLSGLKGALLSLIVNQIFSFLIVTFYLVKIKALSFDSLNLVIEKSMLKGLLGFSAMALVTALSSQLVPILIRQEIMHSFGIKSVGFWEAMNRISSLHLLFITTTLTTYYLPKLSSLGINSLLEKEVLNVAKIVIPIVILSSFLIYVLRNVEIELLFTEEFVEMESLFLFQCIGDIFKIVSWVFSMVLLARSSFKTFIAGEIVFALVYLLLSKLLLDASGLVGVTFAYSITFFLYLLFCYWAFKRIVSK